MENETPATPTPEEGQDQGETQEETQGESPVKTTSKGRRFSSDKPTMSEIIRLKKPNTRSCHILLDSTLAHEIQEIEAEIEKLSNKIKFGRSSTSLANTDNQKLDRLREELEAKEEEAEEVTIEFKFQDIGRRRYDELIRDNRPSEDEKKEYKEAGGDGVLQYSYETFPPKLVSASCIKPGVTLEEAEQIFDEWSEGDLEVLFTTALVACKEPTSLPKSRAGTATTLDSELNSTTALNSDSPTLNS